MQRARAFEIGRSIPIEPRRKWTFHVCTGTTVHATGLWLALVLLLGISNGCKSIQQAHEVQDPASMQPGERTASIAELALSTNAVLTLDETIRLAITNSPIVFQARANLLVAESQLQQARAVFLPQVNSDASYSRAKEYDPTLQAANHYSAGLSFSQDLFSFGRNDAALREAKASYKAAAAQVQSAINTAAYNARLAFFDLRRAQDLLTIANENVRDFSVHLEQVRVMASLGTRIRYDITKAEVDLGNAQLSALTASNIMLTARATLGHVLGLTEDLPCPLTDATITLPPTGEERSTLYQRGCKENPDLLTLHHQADAASAAVDFAISDLYPDLSLSGSFVWSGGSFPLGRAWSVGPSSSWNLFSGWRKTSALDAATHELQASRARIAQREQQLFQDLNTALIQLHTARAAASLAEVVVRSARESLDLVRSRYRVGLATAVELTDAEVAVTQARAQQVQARHDELAALALILLNAGE